MIIGITAEIQPQEDRVALVPSSARALVKEGHVVLVEQGAGRNAGLPDDDYIRAGAEVVATAEDIWGRAELVWKVSPPLPSEYRLFRRGQVLLGFLHLAARPDLLEALLAEGVVAFGAETFKQPDGSLPLLRPMSEVAGRLAVQAATRCLMRQEGGMGVLLGGVPGVPAGQLVVLGGGTVGRSATRAAVAMGATVRVLDVDLERLRWFDAWFHGRVQTVFLTASNVEESLIQADVVIGAALVPGARTPILISRDQLGLLKPGAVLVDVSVDQGGCFESSRPGTLEAPIHHMDGVVHYAVPNMPGAVPRTSTFALDHAAFPVGRELARRGWEQAAGDPLLSTGLNVALGEVLLQGLGGPGHTPAS